MDLLSALANGTCLGPLFVGTVILTLLNNLWISLTKRNGIAYLHTDNREPNKWILYLLSVVSTLTVIPILLLTIYNIQNYTIADIMVIGAWITMSSLLFGLIRVDTYEFLGNRLFLLFAWLGTMALTEYGLLAHLRMIGGTPTLFADSLTILGVIIVSMMSQVTVTQESEFYEENELESITPKIETESEVEPKTKFKISRKPNAEKDMRKKNKVKL
ncbi:MAG: hypothetical protein Q7S22_08210 [Candidatus Micrarchaeota archaeon]|nr:hypothetical protein [Candidatus Micrarchaeota archaeon]